jgi:hypothetical protein
MVDEGRRHSVLVPPVAALVRSRVIWPHVAIAGALGTPRQVRSNTVAPHFSSSNLSFGMAMTLRGAHGTCMVRNALKLADG